MSLTVKPPSPTATDPETADQDRALTEEEWRQRQIELNQPAIALLKSWLEEDQEDSPDEQRAALEWLMAAIDEDRPSDRKLFS
jgi:hypothetical protein